MCSSMSVLGGVFFLLPGKFLFFTLEHNCKRAKSLCDESLLLRVFFSSKIKYFVGYLETLSLFYGTLTCILNDSLKTPSTVCVNFHIAAIVL